MIKQSLNDSSCDECVMPVIDHLEELRQRLIKGFVAFSICFIISFLFSKNIIELLKAVSPLNTQFIQIAPGEVFMASVRVAIYAAFYFASPVLFYQIVCFLAPGLKENEKKFIIPISIGAFVFFTVGILFGYFIAVPLALGFLLSYGSDVAINSISISKYVAFNAAMILGMGVLFQIPLLLLFLSFINIVNSAKLLDLWKYVVVAAFIIAAIVTPSPDPFPQIVVAIVILGLYYLSILLLKIMRN